MKLYFWSLVVLALVLLGHVIGIDGLYVSSQIYHVIIHIVGGIGIGLLIWALYDSRVLNFASKPRMIIVSVFFAGILWEIVEAHYNIAGYSFGSALYFLDTAKDLVCDVIGGTIVAWMSTHARHTG